ncbi:conserved hypothetical protein [Ricinus communis]|uniref:Uncharacterized protein n=1 Tax=Ricinus communis TaxID=3988 RepID=B9TIC2_RICCO|nr:conserved hypothetical protein [Ricinus communis]
MKKVLLLILLIVFPWQAIVAAERNLTHIMSGGNGSDFRQVAEHMAEHDARVLHHHDNDDDEGGGTHVDKSEKSVKHLNDYEHICNLHALLTSALVLSDEPAPQLAPALRPESYSNRTTIPPLRPPRARA